MVPALLNENFRTLRDKRFNRCRRGLYTPQGSVRDDGNAGSPSTARAHPRMDGRAGGSGTMNDFPRRPSRHLVTGTPVLAAFAGYCSAPRGYRRQSCDGTSLPSSTGRASWRRASTARQSAPSEGHAKNGRAHGAALSKAFIDHFAGAALATLLPGTFSWGRRPAGTPGEEADRA